MDSLDFHFSSELLKEGNKFFVPADLIKAQKLIRLSRVSISFSKKSDNKYFIVSGIVRDLKSNEAKIVYKKRLVGTRDGPMSTTCDCLEWTNKYHCPHTAALYLLFQIKGAGSENENGPLPTLMDYAVNVEEYGTILAGPDKLQGAVPNSTYSSLQYLLATGKVINFPLPENFEGKLILAVELEENNLNIHFKYKNIAGEITNKISLLEALYLFNWSTGRAFYIPDPLRPLLEKIRTQRNSILIEDIIAMIGGKALEDILEFEIDGRPWPSLKVLEAHPVISINTAKRKGWCDISLLFTDEQNLLLSGPRLLKSFTFGEKGLLSSFRKKSASYEFIADFVTYVKNGDQSYKKTLYGSSKRESWISIIDFSEKNAATMVYDPQGSSLVSYDNKMLRELIAGLFESFGDLLFRFSNVSELDKKITFTITLNSLFQGLHNFQKLMLPYNISILYENMEVNKWSSKIRFERLGGENNWIDLNMKISDEDWELIKKADLDSGLTFVGERLVILTSEQKKLYKFVKRYIDLEAVKTEKKDGTHIFQIPFKKARIFELFELKKLGIDGALTREEVELCERLENFSEIPNYPVPPSLLGVARPYQLTGYNWLRFLFENRLGACLADDMGLGKTLQAIGFLESIENEIGQALVICPVSILLNWEKEIDKFSNLEHGIYHGGGRTFPADKKIVLTSYGVMRREIETTFKEREFDVLILDEVQSLKNIRSQGAAAARKIKSRFNICMTGTPVENDISEFYNILDLAIPGIWGELKFIRNASSKKNRFMARKSASPFILRRTKAQVLTDLPPKEVNNVYLSFSDQERQNYLLTLLGIRKKIASSTSKKKYGEILSGLLRLRQSCLWQKQGKFGEQIESTKIDFLMNTLEQILEEGHQAIVFSQFTTYLDIIQKRMQEKNWKMARIDGSQHIRKRQEMVDLFQDGKARVFLISLKAAGVGLNLTAASYVFLMDPWWNPAVEAQAIDRAHRIGQRNPLTVYRPIIKDSVEEKVLALQELKRQLFYDLLPEEDLYYSGKLTMKDFQHLFD
ncbi:MAG: DEAD/DEAH box helicase [Deltaproteobacteria bacterium]|nr:MAG: DEAD/DEAH box helicase [Deltaproteobacteria bacterium]